MPEPRPVTLTPGGAARGERELRLAVLVDNKPDLREISAKDPLRTIIADICEKHNKPNPEDYALIYSKDK